MSSRHNKLRCPTCWRYPPPRIRVSTCLDCQACWPTATRPGVPLFSMSLRMVSSLRGLIGYLIGTCCLRSKVPVKSSHLSGIYRGVLYLSALASGARLSQSKGVRTVGEWCFIHVSVIPGPPQPDPSFLTYRLLRGHLCHCLVYMEQIALVREAVALLPKPLPSPINRLLVRRQFAARTARLRERHPSRTPFSLLTDSPSLRRLSAHSR
jgi:hypothetical protein